MQGISYFILGLLALALVKAAWGDLTHRIIPNGLNLAIALGAPAWWWTQGWSLWPDVAGQILIFLCIFAIFAGCFAIGAMGGGDVKLISALSLWLPLVPLVRMLLAMAILGGLVTAATLIFHKISRKGGTPEIPYGVAISLAGLWVFANDVLTTSGPYA